VYAGGRRVPFMRRESLLQVARFVAVGILNTVLDFAILNLAVVAIGIDGDGGRFALFKAISFAVAVAQSYVLNKLWVFRAGRLGERGATREAASFLAVSAASLLVNVGFSGAAFWLGSTLYASGPEWLLANGAAAVGTVAAVAFNFTGYKFLVFRQARAA
jgi:putative flippase GtrA